MKRKEVSKKLSATRYQSASGFVWLTWLVFHLDSLMDRIDRVHGARLQEGGIGSCRLKVEGTKL